MEDSRGKRNESVCLKILKARYGNANHKILSEKERRSRSHESSWWKDLINIENRNGDNVYIFYSIISFKIGVNESTLIWSDSWYHDSSLRDMFPDIYSICFKKEATVVQLGSRANNVWQWGNFQIKVLLDVHLLNMLQQIKDDFPV